MDMDKLDSKLDQFLMKIDDRFATLDDRFATLEKKNEDRFASLEAELRMLQGSKIMDEESSLPSDKGHKDDGRRTSMFLRDVEKSVHVEERRQVVMNMPTPDHKHVFLNSTNLGEYARFMIKWNDFEQKNGIILDVAQIISRDVKNILIYNNNLSGGDFHALRPQEMCELMAKETVVLSKIEFTNTFKEALKGTKKLEWAEVKPNTHEKFFHGILHRKELALKIFNIMMEANKTYCPSIEGKEYGLARVFTEMISQDYNITVLAEIKPVREVNYPKFEQFLDAYLAQAKIHFDMSRKMKLIPYKGVDFTPVERVFVRHNSKSTSSSSIVHHIMPTVEQQDIGEEELFVSNQHESDSDDSVEEDVILPPVLQVMEQKQQERGCINYALYGNCFKGAERKNVSGHNEAVAKRTRACMITKMTTNVDSKTSLPTRVMSREK